MAREPDVVAPLSPLQIGAWLQHRKDPLDPRFRTGMPFRLRGAIDVAWLQRWWDATRARHPAMRSTFFEDGGAVYQRFGPPTPLPIVEHDVRGASEEAIFEQVVTLHQSPQPLEESPPQTLHLFRRSPTDVTFLMRSHHICDDLASEGTMFAELRDHLLAERRGAPLPEIPAPEKTYADFVLAERASLAGARGDVLRAYWDDVLRGAPTTLELPRDRARARETGTRATRGRSFGFELVGAAANARLRELCAGLKASPFRVLCAAWLALIHRHGGQDDILVGAPADCRGPGFERTVGDFVNVMILRGRIRRDMTFRELVAATSDVVRSAVAHRDLPFAQLAERRPRASDGSRVPLLQTSFNITRLHGCPELEGIVWPMPGKPWRGDFAGFEVENHPPFLQQEGHFELGLTAVELRDRMVGEIKYDALAFDEATIARLSQRLTTLVGAALEAPETRVRDLRLMPDDERTLVQVAWTGAPAPFQPAPCHLAIEARAKELPDAIALVHGSDRITYREMDERATRLARALRRRGVGPDARVVVFVPRSIAAVVAMLAVLKAGGAYVPVDAAYPSDRIAFIVEDAAPLLSITTQALAPRLPAGAAILDVDARDDDDDVTPLPNDATASSLAYVIYTSGSTGRPKGVLVEHRGVGNLAAALARSWSLGPGHRLLCYSAFGFDASVADIFPTLSVGATLHLGRGESPAVGAELAALLNEEAITHVTLTPTVWSTLPAVPFPRLLVAVSAGEACSEELVARFRVGNTRFLNNYGPTEITVCATINECERPADATSIGRPMENVRVFVLDDRLEPVPIGVVGEIHLGGIGVARGYHRRPDLTAERFVASPLVGGDRLYRTGDLGRFGHDGKLTYLGRADTQVKLRGQRIELGEIEAVLRRAAGVTDAAVVLRTAAGRSSLAGFVTTNGDYDEAAAVALLESTLPDYMIPRLVVTPELPLSPHGKVDRAALAERAIAEAAPAPSKGPPPATDLERAIARQWADALKVDATVIGREDDFFRLGGDSLLVLSVAYEASRAIGRAVPPAMLYAAPTLAAFCRAIASDDEGPFLPLRPGSTNGRPIYFFAPAGGELAVYGPLASRLGGLAPFGVRTLPAHANLEVTAAAHADAIAARTHGPIALAGWSYGGVMAFAVAAALEARGRAATHVVLIDAWAPRATPPSAAGAAIRPVVPEAQAARAQADSEALAVWMPQPIATPLVVAVARQSAALMPPTPWESFTTATSRCEIVNGDHHSIMQPPFVDTIAGLVVESFVR